MSQDIGPFKEFLASFDDNDDEEEKDIFLFDNPKDNPSVFNSSIENQTNLIANENTNDTRNILLTMGFDADVIDDVIYDSPTLDVALERLIWLFKQKWEGKGKGIFGVSLSSRKKGLKFSKL